jgi:hypothetical protein
MMKLAVDVDHSGSLSGETLLRYAKSKPTPLKRGLSPHNAQCTMNRLVSSWKEVTENSPISATNSGINEQPAFD